MKVFRMKDGKKEIGATRVNLFKEEKKDSSARRTAQAKSGVIISNPPQLL
jgi:hypothetical protein